MDVNQSYINKSSEDEYFLSSKEAAYFVHMREKCWTYGTPLFMVIGTVANILAIITMSRSVMRSTSQVLLIALAIADLLNIWVSLPEHWFIEKYKKGPTDFKVGCEVYPFINAIINLLCSWFIVVLTIFRVITLFKPLKALVYCTRRRGYIALFLTTITCVLFAFPLVYKPRFESITFNGHTYHDCSHGDDESSYNFNLYTFYLCIKSLIPAAIIIIGNILIIYKLHSTTNHDDSGTSVMKFDNRRPVSVTLVALSLVFLVTSAPFLISNNIEARLDYQSMSIESIARFRLWECIAKLIVYINNLANFFCYYLSDVKFRAEFKKMITTCCVKGGSKGAVHLEESVGHFEPVVMDTSAGGVIESDPPASQAAPDDETLTLIEGLPQQNLSLIGMV